MVENQIIICDSNKSVTLMQCVHRAQLIYVYHT